MEKWEEVLQHTTDLNERIEKLQKDGYEVTDVKTVIEKDQVKTIIEYK